ncbi:hypothetical protein DFH06DRAFT_1465627 [Mycena polygramma]|nr:hypothetical protein DFH06DRAFT_1465627 [Mycena polygramma]
MQSPFENILHTNHAPSDAERDNIHDLVNGWRKKLSHFNAEIAGLQSLIDVATRQRDELRQCIDAHLALVSPARRLPDDIIREIFMVAVPPGRNSSLSANEAPLMLCHICSSWRGIGFSTPRLWASVHIVIPAPFRVPRLIDMATTWLQRSGVVPIDVSIAYSLEADPHCGISLLMSALVVLAPRWRHMNFVMANYDYLASISSNNVPLLQTMTFEVKPDSNDIPQEALELLATESLRRVELPANRSLFSSKSLSWGTLRHLKITMYRQLVPHHAEVLRILRQCPLLETCELPVTGRLSQHEPLSLPYLRRLSVANARTPPDAPHFIGSLILPALSTFHCSDRISPGKIIPSRSLFPSAAFLQCLWVNIRYMSTAVLLAALAEFPTLQELHILQEPVRDADAGPDSDFLAHLIPSETHIAVVCPLLQHLALENFSAVSNETLVQFIQSRTVSLPGYVQAKHCGHFETVVPLSRFSCSFRRLLDRDIVPELQDAIAAGLVLELEYLPNLYSPLEGIKSEGSEIIGTKLRLAPEYTNRFHRIRFVWDSVNGFEKDEKDLLDPVDKSSFIRWRSS